MQKVIILKWLPASGKTTWAKEYMLSNDNVIRVNKDLARKQYYFKKFDKTKEEFVCDMRDIAIEEALSNWYDVIVDDTNFNAVHEETIKFIVKRMELELEKKIDVEEVFINTWPETCVRRNNNRREHCVPNYVIKQMYDVAIKKWYKFEEQEDWTRYIPDTKKPKAVIFDIDGTLAKMTTRSPYDYSKELLTNELNEPVYRIYSMFSLAWYHIILFTWRKSEWNEWTQEWLSKNGISYHTFMSRADWDDRNDAIIKKEFFNKVRDRYNIECVFDDRDRVVDMWRSIGLPCFQVWYWPF